jgi:hypothetical protein
VAQVQADQGGSVEVAAQVDGGFGGQERGVLDVLLVDRDGERAGAADRDGGVLAAVEGIPPEGGWVTAGALRVEHVHRAAVGADAAGHGEHIVIVGGGQHGARIGRDAPTNQPALPPRVA